MQKERVFTGEFFLLFFINFILVISYYILYSTTARFVVLAYESTDALGGIATAVFMLASVVARFFCGSRVDEWGLKRTSVIALVMLLVSSLLYFTSSAGFAALVFTRFLHGASFGVANTTVPALVAHRLPKDQAGFGTGIFMLSATLGMALGPFAGMTFANNDNYNGIFAMCSIGAAAALVCSLFIKKSAVETAMKSSPQAKKNRRPIDLGVARFATFALIASISYCGLSSFVNGYSVELGLEKYARYIFILNAVVLLAVRPILGKLLDKYGENPVLIPALIIFIIGMGSLSFVTNAASLLMVGPLMALSYANLMPLGLGVITRDAEGSPTLGVSTFYLTFDLGVGLGPLILGFVLEALGYRQMYIVCAIIGVVALVYYYLEHGRHVRRKASQS